MIDAFETPSLIVIVLELATGSLSSYLRKHKKLDEEEANK